MKRTQNWNYLLLICFILSPVLSSHSLIAKEIPSNEVAFKKKHLPGLKPAETDDPVWRKLVELAPQYEDYEIIKRIFEVEAEGLDGTFATSYAWFLFDMLKANPIFFVRSADRFYQGRTSRVLNYLVSDTEDIAWDKLNKVLNSVSPSDPGYPVVRKFYEAAKKEHQKLLKNRRP